MEMISASASSTTLRVLENGRVEHRDAAPARGGHVDLVDADAEGSDRHQLRGRVQDALGDLGPRPDAEQVHAADGRDELVLAERAVSVSTW
jgi:hypothetical protein